MEKNLAPDIIVYSKELRLPTFRKNYETAALEATRDNLTVEQYLQGLLQQEYEARAENRKKVRIRQSGFPQLKYLQDLNREDLPKEAQERLPQLECLEFIRNGRNLILAGNPGTGKTHLALGLVICDELGYISYDKEGAGLLFNHLSLRVGYKSTIITTNLSFDRWPEIFGDPTLTAAIVDRLTLLAFIINMNAKSYRVKETRKWNEQYRCTIPGVAQIGCRGRQASASGLILPSPAKRSLRTSKEKVFLHQLAVQFSTVILCSFEMEFTSSSICLIW